MPVSSAAENKHEWRISGQSQKARFALRHSSANGDRFTARQKRRHQADARERQYAENPEDGREIGGDQQQPHDRGREGFRGLLNQPVQRHHSAAHFHRRILRQQAFLHRRNNAVGQAVKKQRRSDQPNAGDKGDGHHG